MPDSPLLDHMVVNVRFDMDRAQTQFRGLGFQLTARGYHSLGSINHLMIFGSDYLELIGLPKDGEVRRKEIADAPVGLNGLVFKSDDVNSTYAHLQSLGIDGDPPRSFTRPVDIDGASREASFSTVAVRPGVFAAGRVYFCQHHTPDLVWRDAWRHHGNGARSTAEFWVVARDPQAEAARYGGLLGLEVERSADGSPGIDLNGSRLTFSSEGAYRQRFGLLARTLGDQDSLFGAISLTCGTPGDAAQAASAAPDLYRVQVSGSSLMVAISEFDTVLEFRS